MVEQKINTYGDICAEFVVPNQPPNANPRKFKNKLLFGAGLLAEGAGVANSFNHRIPGVRILNRVAELINFLPPADARRAVDLTVTLGGAAATIYAANKFVPYPEDASTTPDFDLDGLLIATHLIKPTSEIALEYGLPGNVPVGRVDFDPDERDYKDPSHMSHDMLRFITGLQAYFVGVAEGNYPKPEYLYGTTNKLMARWATDRFGFISYHYPDDPETDYRMVGETHKVKMLLEELTAQRDSRGRSIVEKLQSRIGS